MKMTSEQKQPNEIVDFSTKGNVVRFFIGKNGKQYGDDWNDTPYEHNAGQVYDEFVIAYKDIAFNFNDLVLQPADGEQNSPWCKDDMRDRKVPCIIVVPNELRKESFETDFRYWIGNEKVRKFYFGDVLDDSERTDR
ncbi:hypothetical protein [Caudoviricetes sp.]|nr:hypothetical protein [Caudoviricetes sp.]UOF81001.1 hypothetical protein [Caudoviricetes sp.]UOF81397.1 hypothetical protein [Caudoviricetes sp.]